MKKAIIVSVVLSVSITLFVVWAACTLLLQEEFHMRGYRQSELRGKVDTLWTANEFTSPDELKEQAQVACDGATDDLCHLATDHEEKRKHAQKLCDEHPNELVCQKFNEVQRTLDAWTDDQQMPLPNENPMTVIDEVIVCLSSPWVGHQLQVFSDLQKLCPDPSERFFIKGKLAGFLIVGPAWGEDGKIDVSPEMGKIMSYAYGGWEGVKQIIMANETMLKSSYLSYWYQFKRLDQVIGRMDATLSIVDLKEAEKTKRNVMALWNLALLLMDQHDHHHLKTIRRECAAYRKAGKSLPRRCYLLPSAN